MRLAVNTGLRHAVASAMFIWAIFLESAFLLALGGAVLGLIHWKNRKKRLPFTQKILRPPGESLRIRLVELDEKLNDRLIQLFLSAYSPLMMAGLVALQGVRPGIGVWITIAVIAAIASISSAYRLWKVLNLRRRIRLGFEGERHVGEALNQLMLVGYRVFHDFLITDKPRSIRNIDHIVIGPNGVFAVETKTRRKVKGENGAKVTVVDDGLQYPWGLDQRDLAQAEEDSTWLAEWLSKMSHERVKVGSILVLPGWFIDRRSKPFVTVHSGSEVAANIPKLNGSATSESEIRRIAAIIEDRNRSIEY
jgi:Nuclease-related domain